MAMVRQSPESEQLSKRHRHPARNPKMSEGRRVASLTVGGERIHLGGERAQEIVAYIIPWPWPCKAAFFHTPCEEVLHEQVYGTQRV
jgi:hypothetical protein